MRRDDPGRAVGRALSASAPSRPDDAQSRHIPPAGTSNAQADDARISEPKADEAASGNPQTGNADNDNLQAGNADSGNPQAGNADNGNPQAGNADNGSPQADNADNDSPQAGNADRSNSQNRNADNDNPQAGNADSGSLRAARRREEGHGEPDRDVAGVADQLAALVARAARAPVGLIHLVEGDRLRLCGSWGLDAAIDDTLAALVIADGSPLVVADLGADSKTPHGAYLGCPVRDDAGTVLGVCGALDFEPHDWSAEEIAAVGEAARVSTLLIDTQSAQRRVDPQRRFLDAVVDSLHDGVAACDADGNIVLVNARMRRMWGDAGLPRDLSDGVLIDGLFDSAGEPLNRDDAALFRALRGEHLRDEALTLRGRTRRTRYYLVDAQPIVGPDGRSLGAVQAVQDVTRRKRAERFRTCELGVTTALAAAPTVEAAGPRVLAAVVSALDWAHAELWLVDRAAGVVRSAAQWSAPGWNADITVPADLRYGHGLAGRAWQAGKPLWIRDVERPQSLISPETAATSRLHSALAIPVRGGVDPLGVLTVFADVIEDPDDELVALMSGIAAHIGQFVERRMVEDLQRQLTVSKNEYLALIGHELRTPLTSMSVYTALLREADPQTLAADGPAMLEVVDRNANQLRHIIDELLELAALDTGHAALLMTPVDLAGLVREAVDVARTAIEGEPLTLNVDVPEELILPGDSRRLRQIVDNLLGNAVKYSPDGGRIVVRLRASGRVAELTVADSGVGVPPDEREQMFTGRYRTSRPRDNALPGAGLGLTLSRAVVDRHHGTIELTDHDGPGATVRVRLPLDAR